jgi:hypothetical protein
MLHHEDILKAVRMPTRVPIILGLVAALWTLFTFPPYFVGFDVPFWIVGLPALACGCFMYGLAGIVALRRRYGKPLCCPQCGVSLRGEALLSAANTGDCPTCGYAFPLEYEVQRITLDPAKLPDAAPVEAPPSRDLPPGFHTFSQSWRLATVGAIGSLLATRERLIDEAELMLPETTRDPFWQRALESYVKGRRRASAYALVWTLLIPLAAVTYVAILVWVAILDPIGVSVVRSVFWLGLLVGVFVALSRFGMLTASVLLYSVAPRGTMCWMQGSQLPLAVTTDEKTGYYAARIGLRCGCKIDELPVIIFLYRQRRPDDILVRLVNFVTGAALERTFSCPLADIWYVAEIDLWPMVNQTDRAFCGKELQITGDPASGLEIDGLHVLTRLSEAKDSSRGT